MKPWRNRGLDYILTGVSDGLMLIHNFGTVITMLKNHTHFTLNIAKLTEIARICIKAKH